MKGNSSVPFRILSLDGGGVRGAFIAAFLADVEQRLGCRIADHFDLIAGVSTGAIIAAALALGEPAGRIEEFYRARGPTIFTRRTALPVAGWSERKKASYVEEHLKQFGLDYDQLLQSKYESTALKSALDEVFGNRILGEVQTRILIPAIDLIRGQTIVFKTPHLPNLFRDRHIKITDILMATTAAPLYFPHATIGEGSAYVDGGLWSNNPSMVAIVEALKIRDDANRNEQDLPIDLESIHLLSIGTGKAPYFATPPSGGAGIMWWGTNLLNVSSVAQAQGINFQAQYMLGNRAHRIDYELPNPTWSLDNANVLAHLIEIGKARSIENLANLRDVFFRQRAEHKYYPFPDAEPAKS